MELKNGWHELRDYASYSPTQNIKTFFWKYIFQNWLRECIDSLDEALKSKRGKKQR